MRAPTLLPPQTRRGLQAILQRTAQQPQGLKIVTAASSASTLATASTPVVGQAITQTAWTENIIFRALSHLRESFSSMFPKATVVAGAAVVAQQQLSPSAVLCEAALEAVPSSSSSTSTLADSRASETTPADVAMSEILTQASRTPQPLIFSVHNLESYIASKKLGRTSPQLTASEGTSSAHNNSSSSKTPYSAAAGLLHHIVEQYVLSPVVTLNRKVMKTTQHTLGTITVALQAKSATEATDGRKPAPTNWVRVGLSFAAIVVAYDVAILAVSYAFFF